MVTAVGEGVTDFAPGDRVMGLVTGGFATHAVADARMVAPVPDGWTWAQAASVPVAFLTAYYGLRDLARLEAGESVLVHAAAAASGMAAVQLARHWAPRCTARPRAQARPAARRRLGRLPPRLVAGPRLRGPVPGRGRRTRRRRRPQLPGGRLRRRLAAAPRSGGRLVEMGKTDVRDPEQVVRDHPDVALYQAYELREAGEDRIREMFRDLTGLFASGALRPLPTVTWDVRHSREAFRHMAQAKHYGKIVLTLPRAWTRGHRTDHRRRGRPRRHPRPPPRHPARMRHLLLTGRRGPDTPGAAELRTELETLGAHVTLAACDAADADALSRVIAAVPAAHPLTAVVHAAGVLDDGVLEHLTPDRLRTVLAPKADAARHLDRLTAASTRGPRAVLRGRRRLRQRRTGQLRRRQHLPRRPRPPAPRRGTAHHLAVLGPVGRRQLPDRPPRRHRPRPGPPLRRPAADRRRRHGALRRRPRRATPHLVPVRLDTGQLRAWGGDVPHLLRSLYGAPPGAPPKRARPPAPTDCGHVWRACPPTTGSPPCATWSAPARRPSSATPTPPTCTRAAPSATSASTR
ncbi:KR domain-containing protein [Streptomyces parvulus]|nr:KR domain-containing protein [Streptomyces parvulus]